MRPRTAAVLWRLRIVRRAAQRGRCAARMCWGLFAWLLARHVLVPAGMMEPRPAPSHGAAHHCAERPRLRNREIDMADDGDEDQNENDVVQNDADLAQQRRELQWEPHWNSGQQEAQRSQIDREEQHFLTAVVLPSLNRRLLVPTHVRDQFRAEPPLLLFFEVHVGQPVDALKDRGDETGYAGVRMNHAGRFQAADQTGHPSEDWSPDRHAAEEGDKERERHRPMNQPRRETVPDDLVCDDDIVAIASTHDGSVDSSDCAHVRSSGGTFGPYLV